MSIEFERYIKQPTASINTTPRTASQSVDVINYGTSIINPIYTEIDTSAGMDAVNIDANIGKMYKYTGTSGDGYYNGGLYIVEEGPKRIGGRIFYVNPNATGASYTFYDSSYNELSTQTVEGLADAYYYDKIGTGNVDKFYVYDNTTHTYNGITFINGMPSTDCIYWGYYGISTGATTNSIGSGKTNTNKVLALGVPTDYTPNIWGYIKDCRDNSLNECNDWFIGSRAEQDQLRAVASTVGISWYSSCDEILSSVEYDNTCVYTWISAYSLWGEYGKGNRDYCFAMRSF